MDNQEDFFDDIISDDADMDDIEMDEDGEDDEDVDVRTVILLKNEMLALLGLKQSAESAIIVRVDPRQPVPAAQTYDDTAAALKWFNRSLATSRRNGWEIIFDGEPLYG